MTFRPTHDVGPRTQCISGLNHAAYGLPVNASRPGSPQAHASLGSGWRPTLAGWDWIPTGFRTRFQRSHHGILSPLTGLSRHTRWCTNPPVAGSRGAHNRTNFAPNGADDQTGWMKSKVHPAYKTKYRVKNWSSYDRALVQRGDVTLWLSPEAIALSEPAGVGIRGGQLRYSDLAIEVALTLRLLFNLPLRQTEGFLNSLFAMTGIDRSAPDHTTLSRRGQRVALRLRRVPTRKRVHLIVDSTGLSIVGEGEWAAAKHGRRGKRGWKKLHVGVDRSGVIVAQALTDAQADDATTGITLIDAVEGDLASVTADAAYDTVAFYDSAGARGANVVVPPTKSARVSRRDRGRAPAIVRSGW